MIALCVELYYLQKIHWISRKIWIGYLTGLNIGKSLKNVLPYNVLGHTLLRPQNTPVIFLNLNTNVIEKCKGK